MDISFVARHIHTSMQEDYYLLGFSDKEKEFTEYVMIQLAYEFDEQDLQQGMDGEYFEYADKDGMDADYKRVEKVILTPKSITFSFNKPFKGDIEKITIDFLDTAVNDTALEYLKIIFGDKIDIVS